MEKSVEQVIQVRSGPDGPPPDRLVYAVLRQAGRLILALASGRNMDSFPFDENSVEFIDEMVKRWGRVVVPFFANSVKSKTGANGFGSGFIFRFDRKHYLATALHVIEDAVQYDACVLNIDGFGIALENLVFSTDRENDLAVAHIDNLMRDGGLTTVPAIELDNEKTSYTPSGYHLLMGYPGTKNTIENTWGKVNRHLMSVTAEISHSSFNVNSEIRDAVFFHYDPENQLDSQLKRAERPPDLYGMSGGPALELQAAWISGEELRFYARLVGVLVEWDQDKQAVVAASREKLDGLVLKLEQLIKASAEK